MRGSTIDQVRHDIDHAHTDMKVSEQIDEAEKAAGLQSMHPPKPDKSRTMACGLPWVPAFPSRPLPWRSLSPDLQSSIAALFRPEAWPERRHR